MTDYTKDAHALPYPQGVDRVAVAADIQALATKAGIAMTQAESSARVASNNYTDGVARSTRSDLEATLGVEVGKDRERLGTLEGTTVPKALADAKTYADDEVGKDRKWLAELEVKGAVQDSSLIDLDTRAPRDVLTDDILATTTDADGLLTDLTVMAADGQVPQWVIDRWGPRLGVHHTQNDTGILAGFADDQGICTDLVVRESDGQVPDWVIERWANRISAISGVSGSSGVYQRDGQVFLTHAKRDTAGWGSSTLNYAATALAEGAVGIGTTYFNGAFGGLWAEHISARLGSRPALVTFPDNTIPASGEVLVTVSNFPEQRVNFPFLPGRIGGVVGQLSGGVISGYKFTRTGTGAAVTVNPDTPFIADMGVAHRGDTTILNVGKNNLNNGQAGVAQRVIDYTAADIAYLSPLVKRFLVMGHFVNSGTPAASTYRDAIYEVNAAYAARYGPIYIDAQAFVTGPLIWAYTGINPTAEDLAEQAAGNKPPSLSLDGAHLNDVGSAALARFTIEKLQSLGWY